MAITISGENNNDRILASDGVIDSLSGVNIAGVITATSFTGDLTGDVTGNLIGNVTGNINNTTLLLQTGGTERVRITSDGQTIVNGTTNLGHPNMDDIVVGDGTGNRGITIASGTSNYASVAFGDSNDGSGADRYEGLIEYFHNDDSLTLYTAHTAKLKITSAGNIGIGTNIPASKLHIHNPTTSVTQTLECSNGAAQLAIKHTNGYGSFDTYYQGTATWRMGQTGQFTDFSIWQASGVGDGQDPYRLAIKNSGNVGVSTHTPRQIFHVNKNSGTACILVSSSTAPQIRFNPNATDTTDADRSILGQATGNAQFVNSAVSGDTILRGTSTGSIKFGIGNDEKVRITSSGNLEIINNNDYLKIGSGGALSMVFTGGQSYITNSTGHLTGRSATYTWENLAGTVEYARFNSDGDLKIGTTGNSGAKIQIGNHTFAGTNFAYNNDRVGFQNNGSLTCISNCSTYNDGTHPGYGVVLVQGANTSSYNVWGICPDGPSKGNSLNLHYGAQATNIHVPTLRKFQFTGDGYFKKPYHPSFFAYGGTAGRTVLPPSTKVTFNAVQNSGALNFSGNSRNSGYSTTNSRFTAPVAGIYHFNVAIYFYSDNAGNICSIVPRVNGSEIHNGSDIVFFFSHDVDGNAANQDGLTQNGSIILNLAQNDYVEVWRRAGNTGNHYYYTGHSHFCGYLVG